VLSKPGKQVSLRLNRCKLGDPFAVGGLGAKLFQVRLHIPHLDAPGGAKLFNRSWLALHLARIEHRFQDYNR
jgi:hypothetical protein